MSPVHARRESVRHTLRHGRRSIAFAAFFSPCRYKIFSAQVMPHVLRKRAGSRPPTMRYVERVPRLNRHTLMLPRGMRAAPIQRTMLLLRLFALSAPERAQHAAFFSQLLDVRCHMRACHVLPCHDRLAMSRDAVIKMSWRLSAAFAAW